MRKATSLIVDEIPKLEKLLPYNGSVILADEALSNLNDKDQTFLKMLWFFENPKGQNFNLESICQHLDEEWLELALDAIVTFFKEDTFLIKRPTFSLVREGDTYLNQVQFANYLKENGVPYDRSKLNVYISRGLVPAADVTIAGKKYWAVSTVQKYLAKEQKRLQLK
ncbi:hypothetical protein [Pontibacillus litoralis]|uniref:Uncharacterized protein n=1 Tax=Pontibacillus litoralis JSM 072002 TaxID=1385512 RepID=A0A0A5FWP3_9BACI|nr:hypothetical protein [Pontibacillus litoralis]KGX85216.1 hypothetical protein N784_09980 [Pontibacillus litoralis JSM 072002]